MTLDDYDLIDLTHPLNPSCPTWGGSCGFHLEIKKDYDRIFRVHQMKLHAGIGTHIDAPSHRYQEARSVADIPLETLLLFAHVIDVSSKASKNYEITTADILNYEKQYGLIEKNSLVIGYTGWDKYWTQPDVYRGVDSHGRMHFPAFSKQAAELLLQRDIAGLAIDCLSPDCQDQSYPVHQLFLGKNKYIIENVHNASKLPAKGAFVIALPLRAEEASECPIRMVGCVKKETPHPL